MKRIAFAGAGILAVMVAVAMVRYGINLQNELRAKTTMARMSALMGVLEAERPHVLQVSQWRPLLAKYNRSECAQDAWGQPFIVRKDQSGGYLITSLGRDGRRGNCCRRWVTDWDDDAVYSRNGWLQVWNPRAVVEKNSRVD